MGKIINPMPRLVLKISKEALLQALDSGQARKLLQAAKAPRALKLSRRGMNIHDVVLKCQLPIFVKACDDLLRMVGIALDEPEERCEFYEDLGDDVDERVDAFKDLVECSLDTIIQDAVDQDDESQAEALDELKACALELAKASRKHSPIFVGQYRRINYLIATFFL